MLHIKFGFDWPSGLREDLWKLWMTTDGRTTDHGRPISSPCEPNLAAWEKIVLPIYIVIKAIIAGYGTQPAG